MNQEKEADFAMSVGTSLISVGTIARMALAIGRARHQGHEHQIMVDAKNCQASEERNGEWYGHTLKVIQDAKTKTIWQTNSETHLHLTLQLRAPPLMPQL